MKIIKQQQTKSKKNINKPKLRINPEFEQTQKFPSGLCSLRSLRKNNNPNPKNTNKSQLRTNPEFEPENRESSDIFRVNRKTTANQIQEAIKAKLASVDD